MSNTTTQVSGKSGSVLRNSWLVAAALLAMGSVSCVRRGPPKVRVPVTAVSITVLDRFGTPVEGVVVSVKRRPERLRGMEPDPEVASASTGADGRVQLGDLLEDDSVFARSDDRRYCGDLRLAPATSEYILRLDRMGARSTSYSGGLKLDATGYSKEDCDRAQGALKKIVAHHIAARAREFSSLEHYVAEGAISKAEADSFLRLSPLMTEDVVSINFHWAGDRLEITDYHQPLLWVPDSNPSRFPEGP